MIGQDGIMVYDENEITDILNHHFVSIDGKTANISLQLSDYDSPRKYLPLPLKKSTFLSPRIFSRICPTSFKVSKVILLHKGDDRNNPCNYRPISILSAFSKIIERALYNRLYNFLNNQNCFQSFNLAFERAIGLIILWSLLTSLWVIVLTKEKFLQACSWTFKKRSTQFLTYNSGARGKVLDLVK